MKTYSRFEFLKFRCVKISASEKKIPKYENFLLRYKAARVFKKLTLQKW